MLVDAAVFELDLGLTVGLRQVVEEVFIPVDEQLALGLAGNEVVFVGEMPVSFGIVLGIHLPLVKLAAIERVEEHENLRERPIAIEDVLRRV
jgi:hypothetical protein